jgi:hypothetical protein
MKAYSGSTSEGFLPATLSAAAAATATAPAPQDPSATFADALEQESAAKPAAILADWTDASAHANASSASSLAPAAMPAITESASAASNLFTPNAASSVAPTAWPVAPNAPSPSAPAAGTTTTQVAVEASDDSGAGDDSTLSPFAWLGRAAATPVTTPGTAAGSPDSPGDEQPPVMTSFTPQQPQLTVRQVFTSALAMPTGVTPSSSSATAHDPDDAGSLSLPQYAWFGKASTPAPATSTRHTSANTAADTDASSDLPIPHAAWPSPPRMSGASATATATTKPAPFAGTASASGADTDLTGAGIVASVLGRGPTAQQLAPQPKLPQAAPVKTPPNPDASPTGTTSNGSRAIISGSPLATIMAHAAILAASPKNSAANPATTGASASASLESGTENPFTAVFAATPSIMSGKPAATSSGLEKKSAASTSERSFLQADPGYDAGAGTTSSLLQAALAASSNVAGNQPVATTASTPSQTAGGVSGASAGAAGMTNGKKMEDMNSTLDLPSLVVSNGTNPLVTRTSADLHIQLGSNHDFTDALNQVMHVAELGNMSRSTPPLRVAIEIQTPPGAIVNVYVSRQADSSYRAQLSTNDPQALAWVQNQIGSLKNTSDAGSAIRWSPAQLEPGTPSLSTSSGSANSDRNLDWNRGGQQGQSNQQQDERPARRSVYDESDDNESAFLETFTAVGGVA